MYRVKYFEVDGKSPVKEFYDSCPKSLRSKIVRQLRYIEEYGLTKANPNLKKLSGTSLWEMRILGRDSIRIICVAIINSEVVVLHMFKKKSNKTSSRDINISLKRYSSLDK